MRDVSEHNKRIAGVRGATVHRVVVLLIVIIGLSSVSAGPVLAADGGTDKQEGGRHLDIKSLSNEADDEHVTYRVETYDSYHNVNDFYYMRWYFDTNDDGKFADMCIRMEQVGDGRLRAMFYPKCGGESWSTAEARKVSERVLEFQIPTRDLVVGGGVDPGEPFEYYVTSQDLDGKTDTAPDNGSIAHSPLPEPASLFVTAPPDDDVDGAVDAAAGAGSDDTGDARGSGSSSAEDGESDGGAQGGATDGVVGGPIGWLLAGLLVVTVLSVVAVLVYKRRGRAVGGSEEADDGLALGHMGQPDESDPFGLGGGVRPSHSVNEDSEESDRPQPDRADSPSPLHMSDS